ncbi:MAG: LacI family DNA-binding transcriptional regulator [Spirochaetes bacterium]|nr:LacI family DNA-binding transcriptional regulator [Spirochaetota bacterium]
MVRIDSSRLAELCGVSRGTVDRALNGRGEVNVATKARILRMAEKHGYKPNRLGRALVTGKTMTIGLIVLNLDNSFFAHLVSSVETKAREHGYMTLLALSHNDLVTERQCIDFFASHAVDGLIMLPLGNGTAYEKHLTAHGIPSVMIGNRLSKRWTYIGIDERAAMNDLIRHVAGKGYCHLIYYAPPLRHRGAVNLFAQEERYQGFIDAADAVNTLSHETVIDNTDMVTKVRSLMKKKRTAVICSNDIFAIDVIRQLTDAGISVPRDAGVTGFDNIEASGYFSPRITTIEYPTGDIGEAAIDAVLKKITNKKAEDILCTTRLIDGNSL